MGLDEGPAKLFSDQWWDVTQAAMSAGTRNKVDIGLFNGPGWSQSGGPWVKPSGSMRYLDAQEISVEGPRKIFSKTHRQPPLPGRGHPRLSISRIRWTTLSHGIPRRYPPTSIPSTCKKPLTVIP